MKELVKQGVGREREGFKGIKGEVEVNREKRIHRDEGLIGEEGINEVVELGLEIQRSLENEVKEV
ncbi:hypothetical protein HMI54_004742 [Coelomomyces lativittatus]|nr:hypothetical protein HMI54_004742 [Coelomomyces lativittatus]